MGDGVGLGIGMPVRNGANFIGPAIESILGQTYRDFELVICDNASTDETEAICRGYAARDNRVRYFRNERNLGASPNYNRAFRHTGGRYFKWAAHDDMLAPDHLESCIAALDTDPDAVLCQSLVRVIDGQGRASGVYDSALAGALTGARPAERLAALVLGYHWCTDVFGVIRRDALERTTLHGSYHHSDRVLLAELALIGRFARVARPLFMNREHGGRYVRLARPDARRAWHDTTLSRRRIDPVFWRMWTRYVAAVRRLVDDPDERLACYLVLLRWWGTSWNAVRVAVDFLVPLDPHLEERLQRFKARWIGPATIAFEPEEPAAGETHRPRSA